MKLANRFKALFDKAEKAGISRYELGVEIWGRRNYREIYRMGYPCRSDYIKAEKLERAINVCRERKRKGEK